jgi:hypothetical protein
MEEAKAIQRMTDVYKWTQGKVSERFAKTQQWVSLRLALVKRLAPEIQNMVTNRFVAPTTALHIAQAPPENQKAIAEKVQREDLTARETEKIVQVIKDPTVPELLKKAVVEQPKVTPAHVEAIKEAPPTAQPALIEAVKCDLLTVREVKDRIQEEKQIKVAKLPDQDDREDALFRAVTNVMHARRKMDAVNNELDKMLSRGIDALAGLAQQYYQSEEDPEDERLSDVQILDHALESAQQLVKTVQRFRQALCSKPRPVPQGGGRSNVIPFRPRVVNE